MGLLPVLDHNNLYDSSEIEQKVQEAMTEGLGLCPDLVHLPRFLAKYRDVGVRFHASHPQKVPDPNGLLSHTEIATMVNMVQAVSTTRAKYSGARPRTIAPFNVLAIRHPAVAGQVRSRPSCCSVL